MMEFKFNNQTEEKKKLLLEQITTIMTAHSQIIASLEPDNRYTELDHDEESWGFYDYYNILGLTYLEFCGVERDVVHETFGTPGDPESRDQVSGWLKADEAAIIKNFIVNACGEAPMRYVTRYIPDLIDETILSTEFKIETKYKVLNRLFTYLMLEQKSHIAKREALCPAIGG